MNIVCTLDRRLYTTKKASRVPTHIASKGALRKAFTKNWVRDSGMTLIRWMTALLSAWSWTVAGCRPQCDIKSLKDSEDHTLCPDQGWACTEFVGGRNKLHGNKRGTRPWAQYYICMCPGGVHKPVRATFFRRMRKDGNPYGDPTFPTCCPLNCLEVKRQMSYPKPLRLFSKWTTKKRRFGSNHGDVVGLANEWFAVQGALEDDRPYDSNSGRRALAGWLEATHTPYHEGFEINGDLYDVWVNYQPNCQKSNFARRTQSRDPHVATAAYRRFAYRESF